MKLIFKNKEEWLAERRNGIGGSDYTALSGLFSDKYEDSTPYSVWLSKLGKEIPVSPEKQEIFDRGHLLEPSIINWYKSKTDKTVRHIENEIIVSDENPIIRCSLDGEIEDNGIIEAKSTSLYFSESDFTSPSTPTMGLMAQSFYMQGQWNCGVSGADYVVIIWINGNLQFGLAKFKRNDKYIQEMQQTALDWWAKYIITKEPPPVLTAWDVLQMYPRCNPGTSIKANAEIILKHERREAVKLEIKELKEEEENIKTELKIFMKDAEILSHRDTQLLKRIDFYKYDSKKLKFDDPELYEDYKTNKITMYR